MSAILAPPKKIAGPLSGTGNAVLRKRDLTNTAAVHDSVIGWDIGADGKSVVVLVQPDPRPELDDRLDGTLPDGGLPSAELHPEVARAMKLILSVGNYRDREPSLQQSCQAWIGMLFLAGLLGGKSLRVCAGEMGWHPEVLRRKIERLARLLNRPAPNRKSALHVDSLRRAAKKRRDCA